MHPPLFLAVLFSTFVEPPSASEAKERTQTKRAEMRSARALGETVRADEKALHLDIRMTSGYGGTSVLFDKHARYLEKVGCSWLDDSQRHRRLNRRRALPVDSDDSDDSDAQCKVLHQRYRDAISQVLDRARSKGFLVDMLTPDTARVGWA
jgi:hypothetical protein